MNPSQKNKSNLPVISALTEKAKNLGFVSVGISRPERPFFFDQFSEWVAAGRQGDMHWLKRSLELRENPKKLLDGCNAVISLAYPYDIIKPLTPDGFTMARYTEPLKADYHDRLKGLARELTHSLLEWYPKSRMRICIDSAPILERSFAYAAGIGFIGKNNALIVPGRGSYVFLMEILITAPLTPFKNSPTANQCGSCERCINACPTGALESPYTLNATKCLSYLTIEHGGQTLGQFGDKMGNCFFGCDVCQEVCPFNEGNAMGKKMLPATDEILGMEKEHFKDRFGKTALNRAGLERVKRNIRAVRESKKENPGYRIALRETLPR